MTAEGLLKLLERDGALTLVALVQLVTGGPIKGSWWGHPRGGEIFALASALEDSPDVLVAKLVDGKVTFLHRSFWPALIRVVTDDSWRRAAARGLDAAARKLLAAVEKDGEARPPAAARAARVALEKRILVVSRSEHGARGAHHAVLTSWRRWASRPVAAAARKLSLDDARARLAALGIMPFG